MIGRKKIIVLSVVGCAVAGVLTGLDRSHPLAHVPPPFALDHTLLAPRQFLAAVSGWVFFSVYWEIAAKTAAAAKISECRASRRFHVILTNVALLLEIIPIRGLGRFSPPSPAIAGAGLALEAMGLFLAVWARHHLGRNWSGEITIKAGHQLIRSGPYKLLRHPIYTGLLAMYTGTMLVSGERLAIIGWTIAAIAYWRKIRLEEANLNMAFGADYDAYRRETWALLPGLF